MRRLDSPHFEMQLRPERFQPEDKPVLFLDGAFYANRDLPAKVVGTAAYVVGADDRYVERLADALDVEWLYLYASSASSLASLGRLPRLRHLRLQYTPKISDLGWLAELPRLESLRLEDNRKLVDLGPVAGLGDLTAFEFSGGMTSLNVAETLAPLSELTKLAEVRLHALKVQRDGIRPLVSCRNLEELELMNRFDTSDYALLSVALPQARCDHFKAWVHVPEMGEKDVMVVGKGKPFLNLAADRPKIEKYETAFRKLQEEHRGNLT